MRLICVQRKHRHRISDVRSYDPVQNVKVYGRSRNVVACALLYVHSDNRVEACVRAYGHTHGDAVALCVRNDILGHDEAVCGHNRALACVMVACAPLCARNDSRAHDAACVPLCGHNDILVHDGTTEACDHTDLRAVSLVACPQAAPIHLAATSLQPMHTA